MNGQRIINLPTFGEIFDDYFPHMLGGLVVILIAACAWLIYADAHDGVKCTKSHIASFVTTTVMVGNTPVTTTSPIYVCDETVPAPEELTK